MLRRLAAVGVAVVALMGVNATPAHAAGPSFHRVLNDNFSWTVPVGSWSDCDHNTDTRQAYCSGLPAYASRNWWAYPAGWPDTATQRGYRVGGYYDPASTLSVSGGQLHVRMWRGRTGPVHSATVVPKAAMGLRYGKFEERFRVSRVATGYKSAHLLWPVDNNACPNCEIDFPELEWSGQIAAFMHHKNSVGGDQDAYDTGQRWTSWHTSDVIWLPGSVTFVLDGKVVGHSTTAVPNTPADWDIQNESALNGESAAPNSWAQMDIDYVRVWSYS
ncbi:glycoside hydrolase family 16 protein [Streptomyces mirabilis]|uniref:glycoside hydrolase family 16 protein n=1 Tax=Streptomyces mirabilis TaxID=68239 RepID=UPI0036B12709